MVLRNALHGAPIPVESLATTLQKFDEHLNLTMPPNKRFIKDRGYYVRQAVRIQRVRE